MRHPCQTKSYKNPFPRRIWCWPRAHKGLLGTKLCNWVSLSMQWMHLLLILHRRVWLHRCFTRFWLYSTATPHCRALHQLQVRHLKIWNLFSHDYCNVTQGREDGCKQNDLPWWPTDHLKWKWDHKCQQQWRRHSRIVLRDVRKKKTGKCGNFSQVMDPPPPVWECHVFWEKNYGLFCIFWTLETFIVGGGGLPC